jgi:hypothetical protein
MRAVRAVGDAASLGNVAKQAEVGEIEAHGKLIAFAFFEGRLCESPIVCATLQANLSPMAKQVANRRRQLRLRFGFAASAWIG